MDGERDGVATGAAGSCCTGDNTDPDGPDEDGVAFVSPGSPIPSIGYGRLSSVRVVASAPGKLDFWIDFANDGRFDHPGDRVFAWTGTDPNNPLEPRPVTLRAGVNAVYFLMPDEPAAGLVVSNRFESGISWSEVRLTSRFRFSSVGGLLPTGSVLDGEVEDHELPAQVGGSFRLSYRVTPTGLELVWLNSEAVLHESPTLVGVWTPILEAKSPFLVVPSGPDQRFFRLMPR